MDFAISPKMQEILARMRQFVEQELYPLEPEARSRRLQGDGAAIAREAQKGSRAGPVVSANAQRTWRHGLDAASSTVW